MFSFGETGARLAMSFLLGGLIGWEREIHGRVAGLRTHVLVCVGATLFMLVSGYVFFVYRELATVDPARIAAQIITGIGFIGAGTIMQARFSVRGLTTAASLWVAAGIGMAVGCGFYSAAFITVGLALFALLLLWKLERFFSRDWYKTVSITAEDKERQFEKIKQTLENFGAKIQNCIIEKDKISGKVYREVNVKFRGVRFNKDCVEELANLEGIEKVKWE